jgi:hypothetical protein
MVQAGRGARLAPKPFDGEGLLRKLLWKKLQSDAPA